MRTLYRLLWALLACLLCRGTSTAQCIDSLYTFVGGPNAIVRDVVRFDDGSGSCIFIVGDFKSLGNVLAGGIARFDGRRWRPMGDFRRPGGAPGYLRTLAVLDLDGGGPEPESLYVGGYFSVVDGVPIRNVARWDGKRWLAVGTGPSIDVFTFGSFRPIPHGPARLVVGGIGVTFGAQVLVETWDGTTWVSIGGQPIAVPPIIVTIVFSIEQHDDGSGPALFVGGHFFRAGTSSIQHLAKWDGSEWHPVVESLRPVRDLMAFDDGTGDALYVGTTSHNGQAVHRWDGSSLLPVGDLPGNAMNFLVVDQRHERGLLVLRSSQSLPSSEYAALAYWDGESWSECTVSVNGSVSCLALDSDAPDSILAAGDFTEMDGLRTRRIVQIQLAHPEELEESLIGDEELE